MEAESTMGIAVVPEAYEMSTGDLFFERLAEINNLIARRAQELFEASGSVHGRDIENWARAEREILHAVPLEVQETETGITVLAEAPGFNERDLEVRVEPRRLLIAGKRVGTTERKEGKTVYSERHSQQIFRVVDLPSRIDPEGVKATLSDGLLEISLPKAAAGKKVPVFTKAASA
ncbi:MAG TPA: Hsp20 family protein [Candidatus Acidoferrales bacterium]|nr:Hsp20 family protein [Candidatus Acidoferrales bacterium]